MSQICNVVAPPDIVESGNITSNTCTLVLQNCVRIGNVVTFDAWVTVPNTITNGAVVLKMPWKTISRKDYVVIRWQSLEPTNYDRLILCFAENTDEVSINQGSAAIPTASYFIIEGTYITND